MLSFYDVLKTESRKIKCVLAFFSLSITVKATIQVSPRPKVRLLASCFKAFLSVAAMFFNTRFCTSTSPVLKMFFPLFFFSPFLWDDANKSLFSVFPHNWDTNFLFSFYYSFFAAAAAAAASNSPQSARTASLKAPARHEKKVEES